MIALQVSENLKEKVSAAKEEVYGAFIILILNTLMLPFIFI